MICGSFQVTVVSDVSKPMESDEAEAHEFIVAVGGLAPNGRTTNDVDVYDVEAECWLKVSATFSDAQHQQTAGTAPDNQPPHPPTAAASRSGHTVIFPCLSTAFPLPFHCLSLKGQFSLAFQVTRVSTTTSGVKLLLFGGVEHQSAGVATLHNDIR